MPEGPEVETVRRTLVHRLVGRTLGTPRVSRQKLRTPITARTLAFLAGQPVRALSRKGKTLVLSVDGGDEDRGVFVRLGMTGRLVVQEAATAPAPHTHVRIPLRDSPLELRFTDPRRFGDIVPFLSTAARDAELARLGPDGITLTADEALDVAASLRRTQRSIKDALLDQRVVSGVGNIYAAEACFVARLSPLRTGASLDEDEAARLVDAVMTVLRQGVQNRGTSFSDYVDGDGRRGDNAAALWVFQREGEPCRVCGTSIARILQGARSTFLCPRCQGVLASSRRSAPR